MTGPVGTGKTCASLCLLDRCLFARRYYAAQRFVDDAAAAMRGELWSGDYTVSMADFWRNWRNAEITVMDEMGSRSSREKVSDHHYETIKRAIDDRHGKACIWISNLSLDQIAKVYDDRIASRLSEGTVIQFQGNDLRRNHPTPKG
jgi:DNA replication protein DnaC